MVLQLDSDEEFNSLYLTVFPETLQTHCDAETIFQYGRVCSQRDLDINQSGVILLQVYFVTPGFPKTSNCQLNINILFYTHETLCLK